MQGYPCLLCVLEENIPVKASGKQKWKHSTTEEVTKGLDLRDSAKTFILILGYL